MCRGSLADGQCARRGEAGVSRCGQGGKRYRPVGVADLNEVTTIPCTNCVFIGNDGDPGGWAYAHQLDALGATGLVDDNVYLGLGRGRDGASSCTAGCPQNDCLSCLIRGKGCGAECYVRIRCERSRTCNSRVQQRGDAVVYRVAPCATQLSRDRKGQTQ